ncbi:MAG: SLOG family protein [Aristaeellaceae bacterium]
MRSRSTGRVWYRTRRDSCSLKEPLSRISREMIAGVYADVSRRPVTVCFTGHRHIAAEALPALTSKLDRMLEQLYSRGYRDFLSGGALGFDLLAAEAVLSLRQAHPDVRLIMVLPCSNQTSRWTEQDCRRYERILYAADETRVLSPAYYEGCMLVRNRHMVDHCALCLCYMTAPRGGTLSTVSYALKEAVPVINLAMDKPTTVLRDSVGDAW